MAAFPSAGASASGSKTRATLLARLQNAGDALAWDEFFQRYWRLIYAYARRCNCSEHTSEEIVQDVMLKVYQQKDVFRYDPALGRFRDWLGTVVRHKVAELRRRPSERLRAKGGGQDVDHIQCQADDAQVDDAWEDAFEQALLIVLLDVVRREMSPRAYLAFELSAIHELPGAAVARQTGLARNGVYRAGKRALARLKELGAAYREDGRLTECVREAMRSQPRAEVEQALTTRIIRTMQSRWGMRDKR